MKESSITEFTPFLDDNLAKNQYLASLSNCECKHV